jgi:aspartyl-tRNA(Asn)/glutamyl-tRNA(Gln) amidotransferase subunit A
MSVDLAFLPAAQLARRIARKDLAPIELVQMYLERIQRHDPSLAAFVLPTPERALDEARVAGEVLNGGTKHGALHGVPIGFKDLFDTAGIRTAAGSRILANRVPKRDARVVEATRHAGLPMLGKLNMHEFAFGTTSDNPHTGPVRNPWDRARVAGGSSGGSAAAIAAGLCPLALGTDTGGSIRIPASVCGITGLKPTFGRVSRRGVVPLAWSLDHVGPMGRTVEDVALLHAVIAGPDPGDRWCSARVVDAIENLEGGIAGLKFGVPQEYFFDDLEPDVAQAVETAIAVLERLGARATPVSVAQLVHGYTAQHAILASEAAGFHDTWLRTRAADYGADVRRNLTLGALIPAADVVSARRMQSVVGDQFADLLHEVDVIVTPTLPRTALPIGEAPSREPRSAWNRFVTPFNLTGLPAISIPCGFDRSGLPIGLQIAGRAWDESTVLRVAAAYERTAEWYMRCPPGFN